MIDIQAALASIRKIDEAVGIVGSLVSKLRARPDLAALKLAEALDEIGKTWLTMDEAITSFLKLGINANAFDSGSELLLGIEGGRLLVKVQEGRGHCHLIGNVFHTYLNRWFERALKGRDLDAIRNVFYMLSNADDDVFRHMEEVARQLQTEANAVLNIVVTGNGNEARARVLALRKDLQPLRLGLSEAMQKLYGLKGEFIKISGVA